MNLKLSQSQNVTDFKKIVFLITLHICEELLSIVCDTNITFCWLKSEDMYSSVLFLLPDDAPKLQPVVQKSSSPGLVQPEAPVERPEANTPETEPEPPASEPELPLPASLSTPVNLPLPAANSSLRGRVWENHLNDIYVALLMKLTQT